MQLHKMTVPEGQPPQHAGSLPMDDERLRKLADEARRPLRDPDAPHPALFRSRIDAAPGDAPAAPRNLPVPVPRPPARTPARVWDELNAVTLDALRLEGNGLFAKAAAHPAAAAFDILRTRTLMAMQDRGWRRLAVASPTSGCGASLVAANLALGLARRPDARIVLVDLDLRRPGLAPLFGLLETAPLRDVLTGAAGFDGHLLRAGRTLALALNGRAETEAAELLQSADARTAMDGLVDLLDPEAVILDLPAVLGGDEVMAARGLYDAVLLVADGTRTSDAEVLACERLFEGQVPVLGVVLNRAQDFGLARGGPGRSRARGRR